MFSFIKKSVTSLVQAVKGIFSSATTKEFRQNELYRILITYNFSNELAKKLSSTLAEEPSGHSSSDSLNDHSLNSFQALIQRELLAILSAPAIPPFSFDPTAVYLIVGINGSGKTTSVIKLARYATKQGCSPLLIAGDTFRAAAQEQLVTLGKQYHIPVFHDETTKDPATTIYRGIIAGKERNHIPLFIDTAGRIHQKEQLLKELKKIQKVLQTTVPEKKVITLMVLDSLQGNALETQATLFTEHVTVNGIIITKLDAGVKPGIVFSVVDTLKIPIAYVTYGEHDVEIVPFDKKKFCEELFV